MRKVTLWNNDWEFYCDETGAETLPKHIFWQKVTLPHDWQIWHTKELYKDGVGWYRKKFRWHEAQNCTLYFEGVYMDTTVYVNGVQVARWPHGYASFHVDITKAMVPGENQVVLKLRLQHPNSRWYSGAGIFRDVWRIDHDHCHFVPDSFYVSAQEGQPWEISASVEVKNAIPADRVVYTLLDGQKEVDTIYALVDEEVGLYVKDPILWDIDNPHTYRLRARLYRDDVLLDEMDTVCGLRTVEVFPDKGLFLNHRHVVLHGVCMHHDLGCLGAAFNKTAARRQLQIMKDMGVNALRTSHNMPAPAIMDLADEMGLLVVSEAYDCWRGSKTQFDFARFFPDWYAREVAAWVRRDRNHPSLLMWSIGNEIYDTHQDQRGRGTMLQLLSEVRQHDPCRNGLTTLGSNYMAWENTQNCVGLLDVVGYNYGENLYDGHHAAHPEWVIYGSETASVVQSRGIYHFPLSEPLLVDDDEQCSSLGNSRTSWGAKSHQFCISADEDHPYSLGQFLWTGFDYIGEPTPYHTKNSYFGMVDTAGFPKDAFYVYQSGWNSWKDKPVLHLLPYWDFNPGQTIDVCVLSNLPQVELLVNGVSQGRKTLKGGSDNQAHWQVTYAPGAITAVGYDDTGKVVMETTESSFGDAARLVLEVDRKSITADGRDLIFCTISAQDADGNPVRNAANVVNLQLTGGLKLMGMDNGDSTDYEEYKTNTRRLFSGKLLAVLAADGEAGEAAVSVASPGLESAQVTIMVNASEEEIYPVRPEISMEPQSDLVPVRRVSLSAAGNVLTPEQPQLLVQAKRLPENAENAPICWSVTNDRGISANNVTMEELGDQLRITGLGDGAVRVRALCGGRISELELTVTGMGTLQQDPYSFVSAGLFNQSQGEIGNGNERGVATAKDGISWVAFDRLDFGPAGSDTVTIPVFEMSNIATPIRFWKGVPYAPGSKMIGERIYDKPSTWNVYKEETFCLDEPLTGNDVFGIELHCKVHIKGFTFRERSRAWDEISAVSYDQVYGDSYRLTETAVEGIGNNVSLEFHGLDFGEKGLAAVAIRGRSKLENNTVHLIFEGESGSQRRLVEFSGSGEWITRRFELEGITGKRDVTFLFLPGCDFDFQSFRFIPAE